MSNTQPSQQQQEPTRQKLIGDGYTDFMGGQDASLIPDRIAENCNAAAVNVSFRRGSIQPRWGFERCELSYPDEPIGGPYNVKRTYKEIFEVGKFQAIAPYYIGDQQYLVIVVSGVIFVLNPDDLSVKAATRKGGVLLNPRARRIAWSAAGRYLVFFDFPQYPVILDGFTARRADPDKNEVPVSALGAYNQNRLFIANAGIDLTAGDPTGSAAAPEAPITFKEIQTQGSDYYGQIFKVPTPGHNNPITYLGFLQVTDTSTGISPLIVGTSNAVYSYATQYPRSYWEQGPFGTIICFNAGIVGHRAFCNVNSDAFFMSDDGYVRSLSMSRDEQHRWSKVPISREVENWFKYWDPSLISLGFVSYFRNKIFFSVNPYRLEATDFETLYPISDYAHGGMVVMELDNLVPSTYYSGKETLNKFASPIWAGLWTGIHPMDMAVVDNRAFIVSKDSSRINRIYEINPDINYDTADGKIRPVRSRVYTREMDFKDPFANKEIHSLDLNFDSIRGDFRIDVDYKASHSDGFLPWRSFAHYAPWRTCELPEGCFLEGFATHHIRDFTLGAPEAEDCSPITLDYYRVFRKIQLKLTFTGTYWELHELRVKAMPRPMADTITLCDTLPKVSVCATCSDDWYVDDFGGCEELVT